jgi:two-component system chemotaxis response regulator CheY
MKHCMIIDDSEVIRKVARRFLERMQFMISEAENGQDALERCRSRMPDAILLDWHMPTMNGIEFLEALRAEKDGKKPFVVYLTSENDLEDANRALDAGANDILVKPFDREGFDAKFADLLLR